MNALQHLLVVAVALVAACQQPSRPAATPDPEPAATFGKLSIDEVSALLASGQATVLDVNGRERYAKGHLPGARWAAFDEVKPTDLPTRKDATVVFYCANELCSASHDAAKQALAFGYSNVFVMPAGIYGWEKAGKPEERGAEAAAPHP